MSNLRKSFRASFRAKVLIPVIGIMMLLMATMAWIINARVSLQVEADAHRYLAIADEGFRMLQKDRMENLLLRFHDLPRQPYYKAALGSRHGPTLSEPISTLLAQPGVDAVLFHSANRQLISSAAREPLPSLALFESSSSAAVARACGGEETVETLRVGERLYDVVSLPVMDAGGVVIGALTLGSEIGEEVAETLSRLTHSHIVLLAHGQVIASRFPNQELRALLPRLYDQLSRTSSAASVHETSLGGQHYFYSGGRYLSNTGEEKFGYLLFYSSEQAFRSLQATQQILITASIIIIILGAFIVCLVVGRVTQPLREMRDSAEAVGRGDFSRRVPVRSDDECGRLAVVFNRMTENLKASRDQLEATVETLKSTQGQLIQSEKLSGIGEFIAGVAHELNNPLTSVLGFSEMLRLADIDPKHKRYLEMVNKSALRCQKIVQALLGFARPRAPERTVVCANHVIEAALEILQYQLRTSNVRAETHLDPQLPFVFMDPHQIQQVLVNIINNARQAIETHQTDGWIRITSEAAGAFIRITIQDNGPGIPSEHLARIFDPFFTTKEVGKGTGLGLSLCYGIIKEHGGHITPTSQPGEGATFVIQLPIARESVDTDVERRSAEMVTTTGSEGRETSVLVIDDEEPILQMIRETLESSGYSVDVASNGTAGLERFHGRKHDLILCDWKMPGMSGRQVFEHVLTENPEAARHIVFITGDVINEDTREFMRRHKCMSIPKPFTLVEFHTAIAKFRSRCADTPDSVLASV